MRRARRLSALPRRSRWLLAGALGAALAVGATLALLWERAPELEPRGQVRPTATGEMAGMEMGGMNMGPGGSARLTPEQIRTFGVTFGTVEERPLEAEVRTVGTVQFDETRTSQVVPKVGGFLERLYVDFTGQPVRRGQPMVEIYSPELVAAEQDLLLAARLQRAIGASAVPGVPGGPANLLAAAKGRLRLWDITEAQIDQVLRTGRVRRTLTLYAPVSGIVVQKQVLQGQAVQPGQALYTIADLSRVWIDVQVREVDAGLVRVGALTMLEFAAFPGRPIRGRVSFISPTLQEQARTLKARISIPNPERRIKPGMYATARLQAPIRTALTVPTSAVVNTGERRIVFVDMGGGNIMPMEVELGRVAGAYTEVLAGLEPGQRVVTSAQFLIDSESNLAEVMKAMMGQMSTSEVGKMKDMPGVDVGGMETMGADMRGMAMPPKQR